MTQRSIEDTQNDIIKIQDKRIANLKDHIKTLQETLDKQSEAFEYADKVINILEKLNSMREEQVSHLTQKVIFLEEISKDILDDPQSWRS